MPRFSFDRFWRALWGMAASDYLLGALLLSLALALLLAAWLPQTSRGGIDSDVDWQAEVQRRFGGAAWFNTLRSPLQALGAFHVSDAAAFRLLLALLAVSLLARLVDNVEAAWAKWRDGVPEGMKFGPEMGAAAAYLGGLVILLGASVTNLTSWQVGPLAVAAGESVPLRQGSDLTLRLMSLEPDGRRGKGEIWRAETMIGAGELAVGRPLQGSGVGAYLVGSGSALQVRAALSDTQVLELATGPDTETRDELVLTFTAEEPRHFVAAPAADLILLLTMTEPARPAARPQVQVFEEGSGEFILEQEMLDDRPLTVKNVTFTLTPLPSAKLRIIRDPGAFWIQVGGLVLIAGMALRGLWPLRRRAFRLGTVSGRPLQGADTLGAVALPASETPSVGADRPEGSAS